MGRLSWRAWRGDHYIGLAEVLTVLGRITADARWDLELEEVAPGPEGAALEEVAQRPRVGTRDLILAAFPGQIIDGTLRGYAGPDETAPFLILYAVDSSDWDVETSDEAAYAAVRAAFPEAIDAD